MAQTKEEKRQAVATASLTYYHRMKKDAEFRKKKNRLRNQYYASIKLHRLELHGSTACQVCGEDRPWCLSFHHRDPANKSFGLSKNKVLDEDLVVEELAKCDVLCHNCHADVHRQMTEDANA